jgi:hypothetical protein
MAHETADFHTTHRVGSLEGFKSIFVLTFVVFLAVALASMLCVQNWRTVLPGA